MSQQKPTIKKTKKPYKKPKLVRYGSLKELTKFGGSMSADFFGMQT
jgi:hypothetical protein